MGGATPSNRAVTACLVISGIAQGNGTDRRGQPPNNASDVESDRELVVVTISMSSHLRAPASAGREAVEVLGCPGHDGAGAWVEGNGAGAHARRDGTCVGSSQPR
jgi:hypothetical protein